MTHDAPIPRPTPPKKKPHTFVPSVWQHRTLVIWNAGNDQQLTLEWIVGNAQRLGYKGVCLKVADGASIFHGPQGSNADPKFFAALKRSGLIVGGWSWIGGDPSDVKHNYPCDPAAEASRAVERIRALGLDFYISDPEVGYEFSPRDTPWPHAGNERFGRAITFVQTFSKAIKDKAFPRGVASYGNSALHDQDWNAWLKGSPDGARWRWCGQTYWNESSQLDPAVCVEEAVKLGWPRSTCHPMLGCYNGALGRRDPQQYADSLRKAGVKGFSIYDLDSATLGELTVLGKAPGIAY